MTIEAGDAQVGHAPTADGLVILQSFFCICQGLLGTLACTMTLRASGRELQPAFRSSGAATFPAILLGVPISTAAIGVTIIALILRRKWGGKGFRKWFFVVSAFTVLSPLVTVIVTAWLSIAYAYAK